jgi:hypothetical protein
MTRAAVLSGSWPTLPWDDGGSTPPYRSASRPWQATRAAERCGTCLGFGELVERSAAALAARKSRTLSALGPDELGCAAGETVRRGITGQGRAKQSAGHDQVGELPEALVQEAGHG